MEHDDFRFDRQLAVIARSDSDEKIAMPRDVHFWTELSRGAGYTQTRGFGGKVLTRAGSVKTRDFSRPL